MIIIYRTEYAVRLESHTFGPILHVDVFVPWSREVKDRMFHDLARLHWSLGPNLYAFTVGDNPKLEKFLGLLGFKFDQVRFDDDDVPHRFFVRTRPRLPA